MAQSPAETDRAAPDTGVGPAGQRARSISRLLINGAGVLAGVALCSAAMIGGTMLLQLRANADAAGDPNPPIQVATDTIALQASYRITQAFVGRVEAARETQLAFELPGTVTSVSRDEGDPVAAGDVVATLDTAKLEARRAELLAQRQELEANLGLAKATASRQRTLQRQGWAADQRFDEARFRVLEVEAAVARVAAALQTIDVDLAKSVLKAPFAGRVTRRAIDEGAIVAAGAPVVGLLETDRARIRVGLSQGAADKLESGSSYQFTSRMSDGAPNLFDATLLSLRPDLDPRSRTVTALFEVGTPAGLTFGSVVTLVLGHSVEATGAWVPLSALSEGEKGVWTLLAVAEIDGEQVVQREAVEVLHVSDGRAFVRGSMPDGTRYIADGTNRVTPGQHVALLGRPGGSWAPGRARNGPTATPDEASESAR